MKEREHGVDPLDFYCKKSMFSMPKSGVYSFSTRQAKQSPQEWADEDLFDAEANLRLRFCTKELCSVSRTGNTAKLSSVEADLIAIVTNSKFRDADESIKNVDTGRHKYANFKLGMMFAEGREHIPKDEKTPCIFT